MNEKNETNQWTNEWAKYCYAFTSIDIYVAPCPSERRLTVTGLVVNSDQWDVVIVEFDPHSGFSSDAAE